MDHMANPRRPKIGLSRWSDHLKFLKFFLTSELCLGLICNDYEPKHGGKVKGGVFSNLSQGRLLKQNF